MKRIAPEALRHILRYEPETGKLFWRERTDVGVQWNAKYANREAFTAIGSDGYHRGAVNYVSCLAHRVAWAIYYGEWPADEIDHINCNPADNRIANLRAATRSQNECNKRLKSNNRSGYKGVSWYARHSKWQASIRINGKSRGLGFYATREEAHAAYLRASAEMHGEFARTE